MNDVLNIFSSMPRLFRYNALTTLFNRTVPLSTQTGLSVSINFQSLSDTLRHGINSAFGKQTVLFFTSQIINTALGLAVTTVLTRSLSVSDFGAYSFAISLIVFLSVFFDFGLSSAGSRIIALTDDQSRQRSRSAAIFVSASGIGVFFIFVFFGLSFVIDPLFKTNLRNILLLTSPVMIVFPLQEAVISICRGATKIKFLSLFTLLPRIVYLFLLGCFFWFGIMNISVALLTMLFGIFLSIAIAIFYLKPQHNNFKQEYRLLRKEIREFGKEIYYGRIIDGLTNGIDKMLITYFFGVIPVGFYSIAQMMTSPISMLSRSVGVSAYKRFTSEKRIGKKILLGNLIWCIAGGLLLVVACEMLIPFFFTEKYNASLGVLPYIALGGALAGLNVPYHTFLSAQRQGKSIKVMSITTSSINVLLCAVLIPFYSLYGAAFAFISTYGLNIAMNLYYYNSYLFPKGWIPTSSKENH